MPVKRSELQFVPPTFSIEPNNGQRWHTLDAKFITLHALSTAALIADSEATLQGLKEKPKATELDPLFGKHPTAARLYSLQYHCRFSTFASATISRKLPQDEATGS